MPYVAYSSGQKAEAVTLATVLGLSAASEQLGVPEATISSWMAKAGKNPADAIEPASWRRVADLALAKAYRLVAEGRLSPAQLLNITAMAEKGAERSKATVSEDWSARFDRWCRDRYSDADVRSLAADVPTRYLMVALRTADIEPASDYTPPAPDSDDRSFAWACALVEGVPDLEAFHAEYDRWDAERRTREDAIAARARVLATSGMQYHAAVDMAREISADLSVTLPDWAMEAA